MCLILLAYLKHPEYPLIVAANRDEFYSRGTLPAHWWPETPQLFAGKDLKAQGTWMGISRNGRFAAITNVREPLRKRIAPLSRGKLPRNYLEAEISDQQFSHQLEQDKQLYQGYNLLYGTEKKLYYFSNRHCSIKSLAPGIYGLSNAQLDTPWPKVETARALFRNELSSQTLTSERLLDILSSPATYPDSQLPDTGLSREWERKLSAIRITGQEYGTRSSTALLVKYDGEITFHERTFPPGSPKDVRISFRAGK